MTTRIGNTHFYEKFRERTEAFWATTTPPTLEDAAHSGVGNWQRGTTWRPGLSEAEIKAVEQREGRAFPPAYREFLSHLGGGPDRPRIRYIFKGATLVEGEDFPFPNWRDPDDIAARRTERLDGILFHVEHGTWLAAWGERPEDALCKAQELFAAAPPVLPVFIHRMVPSVAASTLPVLSCQGLDTILWADTIPNALIADFFPTKHAQTKIVTIPVDYGFWRDIVLANG